MNSETLEKSISSDSQQNTSLSFSEPSISHSASLKPDSLSPSVVPFSPPSSSSSSSSSNPLPSLGKSKKSPFALKLLRIPTPYPNPPTSPTASNSSSSSSSSSKTSSTSSSTVPSTPSFFSNSWTWLRGLKQRFSFSSNSSPTPPPKLQRTPTPYPKPTPCWPFTLSGNSKPKPPFVSKDPKSARPTIRHILPISTSSAPLSSSTSSSHVQEPASLTIVEPVSSSPLPPKRTNDSAWQDNEPSFQT